MKLHTIFILGLLVFTMHAEETHETQDHLKEIAQEYYHLATYTEHAGKKNKAKELYEKSISFDEKNVFAHAKLGSLYYEENNIEQAISHLHQSSRGNSKDPHVHFNLGQCYVKQQEWRGAFQEFQKTITLDPNHERAFLQLGSVCEKLNFHEDAVKAYKSAIEIDPDYFDAQQHLANSLRHLERLGDALEPYRQSHKLQPGNMHIMMDLPNVLNMLNMNHESLELYEKILEKNPNAISALYNFGFTLKKMGLFERALDVYNQVLTKKPDYAPVHFSLASIYLAFGNYERGFEEYEWRWKAYNEETKKYNRPIWQGEDIIGRTLLVYAEQGLGDTFQFIRYLKLLKDQSKHIHIIFQSQDALITLLKRQPYIDQVISRNENPVHCHYQIPLMSLPYVLKTRLESIPANTPYIDPPEDLVQAWTEKLSHDKNFKIGLCWQGNANYSTQTLRRAGALKSINLKFFAPLFEIPGVSIYSLQQITGTEQIEDCPFKDKLITFDATFDQTYGRFMDTAAIMKNFDLIISVDTGPCHLAGAMNIPTWVILPFPADWRWLIDRSDSPWYPSIRLFRQKKEEDWQPVINEIVHSLKQIVGKKNEPCAEQQKVELAPSKSTFQNPTDDQQLFFEQLINSLE